MSSNSRTIPIANRDSIQTSRSQEKNPPLRLDNAEPFVLDCEIVVTSQGESREISRRKPATVDAGVSSVKQAKGAQKDQGQVEENHCEATQSCAKATSVRRKVIQGTSIVAGLGVGRIFHYRDILSRELETRFIEEHEIETEIKRIQNAMERVKADLHSTQENLAVEIGTHDSGIFGAQALIVDDPELMKTVHSEIAERRVNSERLIRDIFAQWEEKLRASGSPALQERCADVRDVGRRILNVLVGIEENELSGIPPDSVVLAKRLLPSDTIHFARKKPVAFITEEGGPGSHSAILAKSMEIPSISKILFRFEDIPAGTEAIVDGCRGRLIINPGESEKETALREIARRHYQRGSLLRRFGKRALVMEGRPVLVNANVASREDVRNALRFGCDGIGLYRVEPIYLSRQRLPSEEELYETLHDALEPIGQKPVVLRLADFGGDKLIPYLDMQKDRYSPLGVRGIRFLLRYPSLLKSQLRVALRLSTDFHIRVLVPMVTLAEDVRDVKRCLAQVMGEKQGAFERIKLGAMIETPSAVLDIDRILCHADFVGIGTNDLIQYTMAADRENLGVAQYYRKGGRIIMSMIGRVVAAANRDEQECCICGELAAEGGLTEELLSLGIRSFSVAPPQIPQLKGRLHEVSERAGDPAADCGSGRQRPSE